VVYLGLIITISYQFRMRVHVMILVMGWSYALSVIWKHTGNVIMSGLTWVDSTVRKDASGYIQDTTECLLLVQH